MLALPKGPVKVPKVTGNPLDHSEPVACKVGSSA